MTIFLILWKGSPLVALDWPDKYHVLPTEILAEYAKDYAFNLSDLTYQWVEKLSEAQVEELNSGIFVARKGKV